MNRDYPHAHTLPVTPEAGDIDGLQHANNAVYVRWCGHIAWHHSAVLRSATCISLLLCAPML